MISIPRPPRGFKYCYICQDIKLLMDFNRDKNSPDGRTKRCRACAKQYYNDNADRIIANIKKWQRNNPDKVREQVRRYKKRHPDKLKYDPARYNPEYSRIVYQRRQARKKALPDTLTKLEWDYALDYFNHSCAVCGRPPGLWHKLAMDHWIPISSPNCPGTISANIIPLCQGQGGCNNSKHNRSANVWLVEQYGKRKAKVILQRIEDYFNSLK